jgi:hypothetical protein
MARPKSLRSQPHRAARDLGNIQARLSDQREPKILLDPSIFLW